MVFIAADLRGANGRPVRLHLAGDNAQPSGPAILELPTGQRIEVFVTDAGSGEYDLRRPGDTSPARRQVEIHLRVTADVIFARGADLAAVAPERPAPEPEAAAVGVGRWFTDLPADEPAAAPSLTPSLLARWFPADPVGQDVRDEREW